MPAKKKTQDPITALYEAIGAAWGPAITALVEHFSRIQRLPALVGRIADAGKAGRGIGLSPTEVKDLCVLLNALSEKVKA